MRKELLEKEHRRQPNQTMAKVLMELRAYELHEGSLEARIARLAIFLESILCSPYWKVVTIHWCRSTYYIETRSKELESFWSMERALKMSEAGAN